MHIGLIDFSSAFSNYTAELLRAWGLRSFRSCALDQISSLDPADVPVLVVPSGLTESRSLIDYAHSGGTVICFVPGEELARTAGLHPRGEKALPAFLRMTAYMPPGLAGEMPPVVGQAVEYARDDEETEIFGYLCYPDHPDGESPGITSRPVGAGRIIAFAFDLPHCVMLLRQGDPARAEGIPPSDVCVRQSHLAVPLPSHDAGWVPYADLLALLLVDLVKRNVPAPLPLISHLPDEAPAILLYSGDEDTATPDEDLDQMDWLAAQGARMDLNMFPDDSATSPETLPRYLEHHDVGPHPNLRPLDGQEMAVRLADFDRQIRLFIEKYGVRPTCLRNHCVAWAGYTEIVEVMERHGIRMDTNYTSGQYRQGRHFAPYHAFGGAMPVRFYRADGRLHEVFQLHTQIMDDVWFAPDAGVYHDSTYSYRFAPEAFDTIIGRIFDDLVARLHTPLTVCIHPSNWVRFSSEQGKALVRHAQRCRVPVWSVTQWCAFWQARDGWTIEELQWSGNTLRFRVSGGGRHDALRIALPCLYKGMELKTIETGGIPEPFTVVERYGKKVALVAIPMDGDTICAGYH